MRALGYLPDPPKLAGKKPDRDFNELALSTSFPASATTRDRVISILDQKSIGSCVVHPVLQAIRMSQISQGELAPRLGSRLMTYWISRSYHYQTDVDSGTYLRTCFQGLNKFGFCPEEVWPYDISKFTRMPKTAAFQAAFDQREPTVYRRIYSTGYERVDDVKRAIAGGFPVCFGTDVSVDFVQNDPGGSVIEPPKNETIAGGHAMLAAEYDLDVFGIVNSWGINWGEGGWCKLSADYIAWDRTLDLWVVEYAPRFS